MAMVDRDEELVRGLRVGDAAAAERLVAMYGDRAYRLASRIARNAEDAEEIVQDAFLAAVRKIATFRGDSAFGSWVYRIVANAAFQKVRGHRSRRETLSLDELLPFFDERGRHARPIVDWSPTAADPSVQAELRLALGAAIAELPADYRTAVVLHDVEGQSNLEVAGALELSVPNVKSRVHRARLFLRRRLESYVVRRRRGRVSPVPAPVTACA